MDYRQVLRAKGRRPLTDHIRDSLRTQKNPGDVLIGVISRGDRVDERYAAA